MGKKKIAIVGAGSLGGGSWYREIKNHKDFELVGIIDTNTELLENVSIWGLEPDEQAFINIDDMVRFGEKPDVCVVATPIYTHHVLVKEIMDYDINVICEKNMASTIYQARQMVKCAMEKPHLATAVGTQYRYNPRYWTAHKYFSQNEIPIGDIAYIRWASGGNWGEKRTGWRRWLQEIYLEDMCTHWFDLMRYITGMDVVQVKSDTFIPNYSDWQGSSTAMVNLGLAKPEDYGDRHKWIWAQVFGDWQMRGPGFDDFILYCKKGQAKIGPSWLEIKEYEDEQGKKFEEDGYLPVDAGSVEGLDTPYTGQGIILEMMKRSIDSNGEYQPGTNFKEAYKSFAISMAAIESSRTGQSVYVPDYWKGFLD